MREYLVGVIGVTILLALLGLFAYKQRDAGRKFAFAVLILYSIVIPVRDIVDADFDFEFLKNGFDISDYDEDYISVCEEAFASSVRMLVCEEFSLNEENVRVLVENLDFKSMKAGKIRVFLSGRAAFADYIRIEKYIKEKELGECDAEIELG